MTEFDEILTTTSQNADLYCENALKNANIANIAIEDAPIEVEFDITEEQTDIDIECADNVTFDMPVNAPLSSSIAYMPTENSIKKKHMSAKLKSRISNAIIYVILSVMSIIWVLPFFGILFESFRCESTGVVGYIIPKQWGFDNYVRLFTQTQFPKWFGNTFLMGCVTAVVQTAFQLAVAYVLSRYRFKGRKLLMNVILIFGMFPGFLTLILLYTWMNDWHLTMENAPFGLMIIYCASSGMGYYIAKNFFDTIPKSLDEAARVDGATQFQVFYKIILPLSKPIIIYTILMGFMGPWGDFAMASFMANNASAGYNVAAGLQWLLTDSMINDWYTTFCAGGVVVAVPITILFMCLQKYYVAGVTGGAVKG